MGQQLETVGRKTVAVGILVVASWVLFKVVIGVVAAAAWFVAVIVAIAAIVWAVRTL